MFESCICLVTAALFQICIFFLAILLKSVFFLKLFYIRNAEDSYNSVEGYRSNPVLAVKRSLFVEIRFLRSIFFETPCKILALGF